MVELRAKVPKTLFLITGIFIVIIEKKVQMPIKCVLIFLSSEIVTGRFPVVVNCSIVNNNGKKYLLYVFIVD